MSEYPRRFRLEVESRPESVTLVRAALSAIAESLELDDVLADDLKTAVSEACNNVVIHAYPGADGPMALSIVASDDSLGVLVEDCGGGIKHVAVSEERMGVGIALISALADAAHFRSRPGGGTSVEMSFRSRRQAQSPDAADSAAEAGSRALVDMVGVRSVMPEIDRPGGVRVWLTPVGMLPSVLGRLLRATAATSNFTIIGVSDLYTVCETVSAFATESALGETLAFAVHAWPGRVELVAGPFPDTFSECDDGVVGALRRDLGAAVDAVEFAPGVGYRLLQVIISDQHRDAP